MQGRTNGQEIKAIKNEVTYSYEQASYTSANGYDTFEHEFTDKPLNIFIQMCKTGGGYPMTFIHDITNKLYKRFNTTSKNQYYCDFVPNINYFSNNVASGQNEGGIYDEQFNKFSLYYNTTNLQICRLYAITKVETSTFNLKRRHYYAFLNDENICYKVLDTPNTLDESERIISISGYDESLLGKQYADGEFIDVKAEVVESAD